MDDELTRKLGQIQERLKHVEDTCSRTESTILLISVWTITMATVAAYHIFK